MASLENWNSFNLRRQTANAVGVYASCCLHCRQDGVQPVRKNPVNNQRSAFSPLLGTSIQQAYLYFLQRAISFKVDNKVTRISMISASNRWAQGNSTETSTRQQNKSDDSITKHSSKQ